ncbi:MAG: hypothetical protein ACI9UN_003415 [Granulosicoccus sp.]|jgi:hypothetical protein
MQIERMNLTNSKRANAPLVPFYSMVATVALLLGQIAFAAESDIYKTIGDDGATLYTDTPTGNSTALAPLDINVLITPLPGPLSALNTQSADNEGGVEFESADTRPLTVTSVEITSPTHEQTIINPRGSILIGIATGPENGMPEGYTAEIKMNGKVVSSSEGTLLALPVPDRGAHSLEAVVLDSKGSVRASSEIVIIHVKKSSVRTEE